MKGERWNHGLLLVVRRVYELIVGPKPDVHTHHHPELWHIFPVIDVFIKWQRPCTDSCYHFDKAGIDLIWLTWTLCLHYLDNDVRSEDEPDH